MTQFKPTVTNFLIWIAAPFIVAVFAATTVFNPGQAAPTGDEMPDPNAASLWMYITKTQNYEKWDSWPEKQGMYEGQSPHGDYLKLYVNKPAYNALSEGMEKMPNHAIIIKENYNEQKELVAITPMYKSEGYNPGAGDWFWAKYGKNGKVMKSGKVEGCIDCHRKAESTDFLFSID